MHLHQYTASWCIEVQLWRLVPEHFQHMDCCRRRHWQQVHQVALMHKEMNDKHDRWEQEMGLPGFGFTAAIAVVLAKMRSVWYKEAALSAKGLCRWGLRRSRAVRQKESQNCREESTQLRRRLRRRRLPPLSHSRTSTQDSSSNRTSLSWAASTQLKQRYQKTQSCSKVPEILLSSLSSGIMLMQLMHAFFK